MAHRSRDGAGSRGGTSGWFTTTVWACISDAGKPHATESAAAREELCRTYWRPLYHFIRRKGYGPEDAEDLTQAYFAMLLRKNFWERADRTKGRFRDILLTALCQFLLDQRDRAQAVKRGKGVTLIPIDREDEEGRVMEVACQSATPEEHYNQRWVSSLLDRARERLRLEYVARGKADFFDSIDLFGETDGEAPPYAVVAERLGLSVSAFKTSVSRMRARYRELVLEEVAGTVMHRDDIEAEKQFLFSVIAKGCVTLAPESRRTR